MNNPKAEIKKLEEKLLSTEVRNSEEELNRLLGACRKTTLQTTMI